MGHRCVLNSTGMFPSYIRKTFDICIGSPEWILQYSPSKGRRGDKIISGNGLSNKNEVCFESLLISWKLKPIEINMEVQICIIDWIYTCSIWLSLCLRLNTAVVSTSSYCRKTWLAMSDYKNKHPTYRDFSESTTFHAPILLDKSFVPQPGKKTLTRNLLLSPTYAHTQSRCITVDAR